MKNRLSRREFLKRSAVSALGAATVLGMGGALAEGSEAIYEPGEYSATAKGYESDVTVTMTFSETAITNVVIDASGETPGIGITAAEEMQALIVEKQSVDVVTTATAANPGCVTLRKALLLAGSVFLCIFAGIKTNDDETDVFMSGGACGGRYDGRAGAPAEQSYGVNYPWPGP